jgi:hypothetical protein
VTDQNSAPTNSYPASDAPLTLSSGTVVRMRNLIVFGGNNTRRLTVVIQTPTPASEGARLAKEALELADLYRDYVPQLNAITIAVCRTQACIEMREPSTEMFQFVRTVGGDWEVEPNK